ncbi:50S ribosomal protein L17 [bacterium BMS3Abin03]|jgi:large subunit ribosomal protein L17|nr:50S ribosomal protein L17 [bacterium BMS3Abin03]MCG6959459.1 50S ribosomal protein L17 [bacterium BMS3Abin03]
MRHKVKGRKLGRTASHRKATMISLATALLKHKRIKTTLAKAKETRGFVEKLITKAKKDDLHSKKQVMDYIKDKEAVKELFSEIVPKIGDRPGGYTRVVKIGNRLGDAASMAVIELVDYNDIITAKAEEKKEEKETKAKKKKEAEEQAEMEEAQVVAESSEKKEE